MTLTKMKNKIIKKGKKERKEKKRRKKKRKEKKCTVGRLKIM